MAMIPGATAFTRIPRGPRAAAQCFARVSSAPFVAAYEGSDGARPVVTHRYLM
jgi:hypothetical protein